MDEPWGIAHWTVIVFSDETRGLEVERIVAAAPQAHAIRGALSPPTVERPLVCCVTTLEGMIAVLGNHADALMVIDPGFVYLQGDAIDHLASHLGCRRGRGADVALYCDPTESALRGAVVLSRSVECTLVIRGVDSLRASLGEMARVRQTPTFQSVAANVATHTVSLPPVVRRALEVAITNREESTVKRLAASCGCTRRTLERLFRSSGLPSPARLLRSVSEVAASDLEHEFHHIRRTTVRDSSQHGYKTPNLTSRTRVPGVALEDSRAEGNGELTANTSVAISPGK